MLLYRLTLITSILANLSTFLPTVLLLMLYTYISGVLMSSFFYGVETTINSGLLYKPIRIAMMQYNTVVYWWWPQRELLGFMVSIKLLLSYTTPYLTWKFAPIAGRYIIRMMFKGNSNKEYNKDNREEALREKHRHHHNYTAPDSSQNVEYTKEEALLIKQNILKKVNERLDNSLKIKKD